MKIFIQIDVESQNDYPTEEGLIEALKLIP